MAEEIKNPMGTRPVFPLLMSMAIPPMLSMLIQSMYNIVDSIFVARIGQEALTAVSLAYPLQNLALASGVGIGVAINSCIARSLGAGNQHEADHAASHGIMLNVIHALLFILIGIFFTKPFLHMFTQDDNVVRMGSQYCYIVICFSFGGMFHICIEKMFQATGSMVIPMLLQAFGALINIVLDPVMIFGLFGFPAMGVAGAGIATIIGQLSACGLAFLLYFKKGCGVTFCLRSFRFDKRMVKNIYLIAIPSGIMMALPSVLVSALNGILASMSQTAIAVFGLYYKLQTFVYMPANGLVQGMRPIAGYNYGAGLLKRLSQTVRYSILVTAVIMGAGTLVFWFFPQWVLSIFNASEPMQQIGVPALRIISIGFIPSAAGVILSGMFEALGKGPQSLIISLIRQLLLTIPLSAFFGIYCQMGPVGVWITFPISEAAAILTAIIIYRRMASRLNIKKNDSWNCL